MRLTVEASGGVRQENVRTPGLRGLNCVEDDGTGIGARLLSGEVGSGSFSPNVQLLDGGGAERVAGREHDAMALICEPARKFADARGLAGTVDADHENHKRRPALVDD